MKIIDTFIFYNELKMLDFRLKELYEIVDYFIIVEATKTHSNNEKILYFEENKHLYKNYINKIIHIVVDDVPNAGPEIIEKFHRNCIDRGINKLSLVDEDIIIISDCDEIPDSNTLKIIKENGLPKKSFIYNWFSPWSWKFWYYNRDEIFTLEQDMYYYNLNNFLGKWRYSKILTYKNYKNIKNPHYIRRLPDRNSKFFGIKGQNLIKNGGWHFSYFGDIEFIKNKLKNFLHQEYNNDKYLNDKTLQYNIENNKDILMRNNIKIKYIDIQKNNYLPINYKILQ